MTGVARLSPRVTAFSNTFPSTRPESIIVQRPRKRSLASWHRRATILVLTVTFFGSLLLLTRSRINLDLESTALDAAKIRKIGVQQGSVVPDHPPASKQSVPTDAPPTPEFSLWSSQEAKKRKACYDRGSDWQPPPPLDQMNGYLHVLLSGGLNQMRVGLCDAVVVARVLNATLVVPHFDKDSWWDDHSSLDEVFDVDHFIDALKEDVRIVKTAPADLASEKLTSKLYPRKSTPEHYIQHALPLLKSKGQLELRKFDFRLADRIDSDLQKLRCRANYRALRFIDELETIGERLVGAVREGGKPFVGLHLRFEPDMLAFSGCNYGLGPEQEAELLGLRARWKNLPKDMDPDHQRRHGHCVLTPEEVGRSLQALGYPSETLIYVASGPIFGGETSMKPLRNLFPNLVTKTTLMTPAELEPLERSFSKLAALDYIVCSAADAFISNNNGNMARVIAGERLVTGIGQTVLLAGYDLLRVLDDQVLSREEVSRKVKKKYVEKQGDSQKGSEGTFFSHPVDCVCVQP